jgi:hypothetical protein
LSQENPSGSLAEPVLQTASGEIVLLLKEAFVELNLGRRALRICVFVAEVTDEIILGLDVLRA